MTGIITTYFTNRGYGFITVDDGTSHFFHRSNYRALGTPKLGVTVEFDLADPNTVGKKKQAVNIAPQKGGEGGAS